LLANSHATAASFLFCHLAGGVIGACLLRRSLPPFKEPHPFSLVPVVIEHGMSLASVQFAAIAWNSCQYVFSTWAK
jgi:hypothetical protein